MKKLLVLLVALGVAATVAAGCGGDDSSESGSATTAVADGSNSSSSQDAPGESGGSSGSSGNADVDAYCDKVRELGERVQEAAQGGDVTNFPQLTQDLQELAGDAIALGSEVGDDPALAAKAEECGQQVAESLRQLATGALGGAIGGAVGGMDGMDGMESDSGGS